MAYRDIRRLDLNLLVVLDALHKERSVTRAADRLSLTQPTVSGMLKRLREVFGDDLYVRTSHGVVPTPRAEALAPQVAEILEAAGALLAPPRFDPATSTFSLTLCGSDYLLQTILGALAGDIVASAPGASVSVVSRPTGLMPNRIGEIETLLARGEIDLVISMGDAAFTELPSLTLYQEGLLCVSSYACHEDGQRIATARLCDLNHVILGSAETPVRRYIDDRLAAQGLERNVVLRVPNFATLFQAMRHGEFVAFMPGKIAELHSGFLRFLRTELDLPQASVIANWHPGMDDDARHVWLREKLKTYRQYTR